MIDETKIKESQISDLSHEIEIQEDDAQKESGATVLNFEGGAIVVDEGSGKATVTISGGGGSSSTFLELTDSPSSYSGHAGKSAIVNSGETALEFTTISGGGGTDANAIHDNVDDEIINISEKTTVVDADILLIEDSEASYNKKSIQIGNLPSGSSLDMLEIQVFL